MPVPGRPLRLESMWVGAALLSVLMTSAIAWAGSGPPDLDMAKGKDLFLREWAPDDPRSHAGDGLGPVYNETSCVACHFQGGPGGSGPNSTNVEIVTISGFNRVKDDPATLHPGFRSSNSVVLHRFGTDPEYNRWRLRFLGQDKTADMAESVETEIKQVKEVIRVRQPGLASSQTLGSLDRRLVLSMRNPPLLFGAGLIDTIPDEALLAASDRKFQDFREVKGRISGLRDGKIGRFGWKAQSATLKDFVLGACATELGLEVPDHHQGSFALNPNAPAKGLDLTQEECDALVRFVRNLPVPVASSPARSDDASMLKSGRELFENAGCATCHAPKLGDVEGIYSDLLLHDMGQDLADAASYHGGPAPTSFSGVKSKEWRTPPLWGFRDSAPYLHDGRAQTLDEAVALHGGEASASAQRFFKLLPNERLKVQAFLRSLHVPAPRAPTGDER
jgi:CxxC motif-containing protein (DUF1111 family)